MRRRRLLRAILLCAGVAAAPCKLLAQRGARAAQHRATATRPHATGPQPVSRDTKPFAMFSASATKLRDSLVALARAQVGVPYVYGGTTPEGGFDCSGLIKYVMAALNVRLPRTAAEQARTGEALPKTVTALRPGDLVTFGRGKTSHIGIYVGDGHMVHASTAAGRVIEVPLNRKPTRQILPWRGARRLVVTADNATIADSAIVNR